MSKNQMRRASAHWENMPTCSAKKSSVPLHSNFWENCDHDKCYEACYRFNKEQYYEGEFFRDSIHGQGTYKWNDVAVHEGSFYSNAKEGYAGLSLPDNSYFEGLFIRNEPFGPGIFTYANGRQDAGFWVGRKLVRLSRAVDFIIPRLAPTSAAKLKLLQFRRLIPLNETDLYLNTDVLKKCGYPFEHFYSPYSSLIYDPRSIFFDTPAFEKTYFVNIKEVLQEFSESQKSWESIKKSREDKEEDNVLSRKPCLPNADLTAYKDEEGSDICDKKSSEGEYEVGILGYFTKFGTIEGLQKNVEKEEEEDEEAEEFDSDVFMGEADESKKNKSRPSTIVSWNRSELCTEMLKQIFRYRAFEEKLTFDLAQLMIGVRTAFRRTGLKEKQCLQFLKMCSLGPAHIVRDLLCSHEISEELMDARGNNSLMFAAATDQHEIIDILLDYGVDVNTFNDENLTPLNLCLLRRLAYSNGISNWETAFLPKEIDVPREYQERQVLENQVSISSLDRIFGDGMSLSDSKSRIFDSRYLTPFPSPTVRGSNDTNQLQYHRFLDESQMSDLSQITILNIGKSPGSHILIHCGQDDEPRMHFGDKRSSSTSGAREMKEETQPLGSNEETPRINIHMIPKSNKRDEFLRSIVKSNKDRYLFEFTFEQKPPVLAVESKKIESLGRRNKRLNKQLKADSIMEEKEEEQEENVDQKAAEELVDVELTKKIAEIDKTIQKLLRRGADPNISEVPKPAIHLAIYTKDLNTVYNLLLYGANPNSQLYANEGLLTPLHVVVLQPSSREQVDICELLLEFKADPNKETHPEFSICEHEKGFLSPEEGRTPLQLLCMRPDLEYADPDGNLIQIALLLAADCNKKCFYNGHSYLTLAMLFGNKKLLKALLKSNFFDPNEVLGKDRGTALHVLVSTELQKKTTFDDSISMCDSLIEAGANPLKKFQHPKSLQGTCVDYGYRQIEAEKELRRGFVTAKKTEKLEKDKNQSRDYLQDHVKVVEYLSNIAKGMAGKKKFGKRKRGDSSRSSFTEDLNTDDFTGEEFGEENKMGSEKDGFTDKMDKGQRGKMNKMGSRVQRKTGKAKQKGKDLEDPKNEGKKRKKAGSETKKSKKGGAEGKENIEDEAESERGTKRKAPPGKGKTMERDLVKHKKRKEDGEVSRSSKKTVETVRSSKKNKSSAEEGREKGSRKGKEDRMNKGSTLLEKESKKDQYNLKEKDSNMLKLSKYSIKHSYTRQLGARSETFPEKLRQNLLKIYGNCFDIDITEFLVPYVVLRDGELYYRFHGKTRGQKEQYSLI